MIAKLVVLELEMVVWTLTLSVEVLTPPPVSVSVAVAVPVVVEVNVLVLCAYAPVAAARMAKRLSLVNCIFLFRRRLLVRVGRVEKGFRDGEDRTTRSDEWQKAGARVEAIKTVVN